MKFVENGVCAPQGFQASGIHVGVKTHAAWKKDVALIVSDVDCAAAAMFTTNVVKAAPIHVDRKHLADGKARAIVANSGNANACAPQGEENAIKMCAAAAKAIGCPPEDVLVSSTGVIGQTLKVQVIEEGMPALYEALDHSVEASDAAAHAIMTTDTVKKEVAVETVIGGKTVRMGGIAKGSGMIHPNMGTMLCFLTTDCAISPAMIRAALKEVVCKTFNRISVDGDTSTNDSCIVLANGLAGNVEITEQGADYRAFTEALMTLCTELARKMAADGEGATRLITVTVRGAATADDADAAARTVANSPLVKTAVYGHDANWGRVAAALGRSGARFNQEDVDIDILGLPVCRAGLVVDFDEEEALRRFEEPEVAIEVDLHAGEESATMWTCDFSHEYVTINGDYRS